MIVEHLNQICRATVLTVLAASFAVSGVRADIVETIGQTSGQIHDEFTRNWIDKPIIVERDGRGQTVLRVGNLQIGGGRGHYRARCVLDGAERVKLIGFLDQGLRMCSETTPGRQENEFKRIGEFIRRSGPDACGMRVGFFEKRRELNPVGVILWIKDFEDNYQVKLYLYPERIRHLRDLLGEAAGAVKEL